MERFVAIAEASGSGSIHDYAPNLMNFNFSRFCDPRLKSTYKRLPNAIKQVKRLEGLGWPDGDFIIVACAGRCVIGFDTEAFRCSIDFKENVILWQKTPNTPCSD